MNELFRLEWLRAIVVSGPYLPTPRLRIGLCKLRVGAPPDPRVAVEHQSNRARRPLIYGEHVTFRH